MIVTLYLICANVYNSVDAPKSRGFSFIELWLLGAQFPILLALFEYGYILYLKKLDVKSENQIQPMTPDETEINLDEKIKKLDFGTMIFSFFSFISFVFIYTLISHS